MVFGLFGKKCSYCKSKITGKGITSEAGSFCCPNCESSFMKSKDVGKSTGCCG